MINITKGIGTIFKRECIRYTQKPIYLICIIIIPILCYGFFLSLMWGGVPERLPIAVVDHDQSKVSRNLIRTLDAMSSVDVVKKLESYSDARAAMQRNEIYAFMEIPEGFSAKAASGKQPTLTFFSNDAYFVAGLFSYKALKMSGALANGAVVKATMEAKGMSPQEINVSLQPTVLNTFPLGNPWINYSIFINNAILPGILELMILLMTVFAIGVEIKEGTSRRLLVESNRSMLRLLIGKLMPQTVLFTLMGWLLLIILYGYLQFPDKNGILPMAIAIPFFVISCQSLGVFMIGCLPTLRLGLSFASLFGVIAFSVVGFSLPVYAMYKPFQILAWLYPLRHYFLIYNDQALNGFDIWYSLPHYLALVLFLFLPLIVLVRLKKALYQQKYKP
ncbi:MAG: ABC transporter permease [Bacteroidales bacterium]|nr:ABC transporter permease [Bacteroidales bacterium]